MVLSPWGVGVTNTSGHRSGEAGDGDGGEEKWVCWVGG